MAQGRRPSRPHRSFSTRAVSAILSAPARSAPGESARLDFNASDMNDVLKSLTISGHERRQNHRPALRFQRTARARSSPISLSRSTASHRSAHLLDQLKGARIELKFGADTLSGIVVSGRVVAADDKQPEREQLVALLDSRRTCAPSICAPPPAFVSPTRKLQTQFRDYLAAVDRSRSKDKRSVYIDSTDARAADRQRQLHDPRRPSGNRATG